MQTFDNLKNPDQKWENFGLVAALTALMEVFNITEKASNTWFDAIKPGSTLNRIQLSIGFITQLNTLVDAMETFDTLKNPDQKWENFGLIAALTALMEAVTFVNTHDGLGTKQQIDLSFITNLTAMVMAISSLSKDLVLLDSIENTKEKWSNFGLIAALTALIEAVAFVNSNLGASNPLAALSHLGDMTAFAIAISGMTNSVVELSKVKSENLDHAVEAVAALTGLVAAFEGLGQLINKSLAPATFSQGLNEFLGPLSSLLSIGGLLVGLAGLIVGVKLLGEMDTDKLNQGISAIVKLSGIVTAFSTIIGVFSTLGIGGSVQGAIGAAAGIAVFTIALGAILYGLSWLTELDESFLFRIEEGAKVVRAIFEGVGEILAGIVSPIASIFMPQTITLEDGTEQILNLQDQLHQLGEIGAELNIDGFNKMMDAVGKVQEIANIKINDATFLSQWLAGEKTLMSLGDELGNFGTAVKTFGDKIQNTNLDNVERGAKAIKMLAESINLLQKISGGDLMDLSHLLGFKWDQDNYFETTEDMTDWSGFISFFSNISNPINEGISEGALSIDASPIITAIVAGITGGSDQIRAAIAATLGGIDLGSGDGTADLSDLNLVDGIEEEAKNAWDSVGGYLSQLGLGDVLPEMDLSTITEPLTDMLNTGKETVEGEKDSYLTIFTDLFSTFGLGADANKGNAYSAGSELANGAAAGASANSGRFFALGAAAGRNYLNGFKWASRIGSPSKAMIEMMGYIADGFELGQDRYGSIFTRTGEEEADAYLQAMKEELEPLSLAMAEGIDTTPVIRPVIDMSNIEEGMQWMRGAFGRGYGVSPNGSMPTLVGRGNVPAAATVNPNQNGSSINRIVDSINSRLDRMQDAMEHWEMVLDSGELVGGIVDKMDKSLGVRAAKARRRG